MFADGNTEISVSGNAIVRVEPDLVSVTFAVVRTSNTPQDAFESTRASSQEVRLFLREFGDTQVRSSRMALHQEAPRGPADQRQAGYVARIEFSVLLRDVEAVEQLISGVFSAGANQLGATVFQTSRLKEVRDRSRQMAVAAAREKAENYCTWLGIELGPAIRVMESSFDPTQRAGGHVSGNVTADRDDALGTFSPISIAVGASANIVYRMNSQG